MAASSEWSQFDNMPLVPQAESEEVCNLRISASTESLNDTEMLTSTVKDLHCLSFGELFKSGLLDSGSGGPPVKHRLPLAQAEPLL